MDKIIENVNNITIDSKIVDYYKKREELFLECEKKNEERLKRKQKVVINISLIQEDEIKEIKGTAWVTKPIDIIKEMKIKKIYLLCKVNDILWDLKRELEEDCKIKLLNYEDEDVKKVFWHSSAHILGLACELYYKALLSHGPVTNEGFFYDFEPSNQRKVTETDYKDLLKIIEEVIQKKEDFKRILVKKEDLIKLFKGNPYKLHYIKDKIKNNGYGSVYKVGSMIDLCEGPHLANAKYLKSFEILKNSSCYFLGDQNQNSLQRIYGISFPNMKSMKNYLKELEISKAKDHRKIGKDQDLFMSNQLSPGSYFFLANGTIIYNRLIEMIRDQYWKRGFQEVITPNIYKIDLWKESGHWEHYKENIFSLELDKEKYALKPMNCPGHCLIYKNRERSYREHPIRLADFGVLHRNELTGALTGLTRVRRFQQDDAHIFCTKDQIKEEILNSLYFVNHVYKNIFEFDFQLKLSTRPKNYMGTKDLWDYAETKLKEALTDFCKNNWKIEDGDGAFYGPKIDITILDAYKREHQCATIQLDFQLPERFNLRYKTESKEIEKSYDRPVIIHRAILGSIERMIGILTESYAGYWPFWLSPRQIRIIPCNNESSIIDYVKEIENTIRMKKITVEVDLSDLTFNKKVLNSHIDKINIILIVGKEELNSKTVTVRTLSSKVVKNIKIKLSDLIQRIDLAIFNYENSFSLNYS